jgi:S-formylglutathione hydrolase FrmB
MEGSRPGKGRIAVENFPSEILELNPLGDPFVRELMIYLPPSYDKGSTRYPVTFCLAGYTGSARSFFNFQAWVPRMDERMDLLIQQGTPEMILAFPDCFTRAVGNYRSYLVREVIPFVDHNFRTRSDRSFRAVLGKSSGGYGAITLAMEHPEVFSAVACHSGDMYFEYAYLPEFPAAQRRLESFGGLQKYLKEFDEMPKTGKDDHSLLNAIAMSACYSPNLRSNPHQFDLPFDESTGELRWDIWQKWKQKDPLEIVKSKGTALKDYRLVYLDCGKRDEFFLHLGARMFSQKLNELNVPHLYEEFEDGHFSVQHRYTNSLRKIADALNHG